MSRQASGKVLVYLRPKANNIKEGDQILFANRLQKPKPNPNPKTFNYMDFLASENVHYLAYLDEHSWKKNIDYIGSKKLQYFSKKRSWIRTIIEDHFENPDYAGVVKAISIGDRTAISSKINDAFVDTGAVHILAISGLHVGVVASLFLYLLSVFQQLKIKILIALLALSAIWSFALISGLGPSVQRAALMFSLFIVTRLSTRQVSVYNVLGGSALILLFLNPFLLYKLGFQFSYLAVISIVAFYPMMKRLIPKLPKFWSKILDICLVSIAAQILVSPISMFHFHQISLMSAFSSLVAIPAIVILVYAFAALLVLKWFDVFLIDYVVNIMEMVLDVLFQSIFYLSQMPWCKLEGFYPSEIKLVIIYLFLFSGLFMLLKQNIGKVFLIGALVGGVVFNVQNGFYKSSDETNEIIVYSTKRGLVIDCFFSKYMFSFQSRNISTKDLKFNCKPYRDYKNADQKFALFDCPSESGFTTIEYDNKKICFVKDLYVDFTIDADHIFLLGNASLAPEVHHKLDANKIYAEKNSDLSFSYISIPNSQVIII